MSLDYSLYVPDTATLSVPRINLSVSSATLEEIETAISTYNTESDAYAESFRSVKSNSAEAEKQFMLEAGVDMSVSGLELVKINYKANTYQTSEKVDNIFNIAKSGNLLTSTNGLSNTYDVMKNLYNEVILNDNKTVTSYELKEETFTFDEKPFIIEDSNLTNYGAEDYFIRSQFGLSNGNTSQVYTLYSEENSVVAKIYYVATTRLWGLYTVSGETETLYATNATLDKTGWTIV